MNEIEIEIENVNCFPHNAGRLEGVREEREG